MPRLNPLLHWPRPMRIVLQKFFVVIGFDHERLHFPQSFDQHFRRITEIGDEAETTRARVKGKAERIYRVMRYRERLHGDVANRERRAGPKNSPVTMSPE